MNKEQQELLDDAHKDYVNWWEYSDDSVNLTDEESEKWLKLVDGGLQWSPVSKEEFIDKCKTDTEFSEKWGVKIEERELSFGERVIYYETTLGRLHFVPPTIGILDKENIPTKLITIAYYNETIESYE